MNEYVERLDRSLDIVVVFLSIISAAIFQYVTALPYDPMDEPKLELFMYFTRFSLKLLFLPFLFILPTWLMTHILRNENWRMLLRTFVWSFTSVTMAINTIIIVVLGFPLEVNVLEYPGIITGAILVGIPFVLVFLLQKSVFKAYKRALMDDPSSPARDFFFESRWKNSALLVLLTSSLLWLAILLASI